MSHSKSGWNNETKTPSQRGKKNDLLIRRGRKYPFPKKEKKGRSAAGGERVPPENKKDARMQRGHGAVALVNISSTWKRRLRRGASNNGGGNSYHIKVENNGRLGTRGCHSGAFIRLILKRVGVRLKRKLSNHSIDKGVVIPRFPGIKGTIFHGTRTSRGKGEAGRGFFIQ